MQICTHKTLQLLFGLECFAAAVTPTLFPDILSWCTPGSSFPLSRQVLNVALVVQGEETMHENEGERVLFCWPGFVAIGCGRLRTSRLPWGAKLEARIPSWEESALVRVEVTDFRLAPR